MNREDRASLARRASQILRENDRGAYTVPTKGLYPFQWNWDSCLTALGFAAFDEDRAWREMETLFAHQWPDGMVPHIIFHQDDDGYFPGPDVWQTGRSVPTSGITQPAVAGFAARRIFERSKDKAASAARVRSLVQKIDRWHAFLYSARDPRGEGLVAIIHPWESGRDNAIDWDEPFQRVPSEGIAPYRRRDVDHADPAHRPTKEQYDRYLWLLEHFRRHEWDNEVLHDLSPFRVVDPGFNAILIRSCADLAALAEELGAKKVASANRARAKKGLKALERLWSERHGQYLCLDRTTESLIDSPSVGGLIAVFAAVSEARAGAIGARITEMAERCCYVVPSHDPADPRFDAKRYWRGPAWLIVNYLISDGLAAAGMDAVAETIRASSLQLIEKGGFAEYYDPLTGEPCGGDRFTWTAAMVLEFLRGGEARELARA
ncbi:amylo-alpha-1,6-glucosidase [Chelativorans salis]|uniref:Trehalase family glycosidase n=1 Tax=Chelativorans salis TaxID=2978478 RepID=A0ABT2LH76_9HYPH|nr:trehalase family glycosidase [Chelativorans sp. EGI FJ00035]MCT7373501.1 trehalase family glycosidase [Chelativorans sp. EGI FJ00035]